GETPLLLAAARGHLEVTMALIDAGADRNLARDDGWTPLHAAVSNVNTQGSLPIATLMIEKGAKIEASDKNGWTPLLAATFAGNLEAMRLLLDRGASLKAVDVRGSPALHVGAYVAQPQAIRLLLERGADPAFKNKDGNTALDLALGGTKIEVVGALLSATHIDAHFRDTPLKDAIAQLCQKADVRWTLGVAGGATVTIDIDHVPFPGALSAVLHA